VISPVLPTYARYNVAFVSGAGAYLRDDGGNDYLDFAGGIAVNALGHAHPRLVAALTDQAAKLWHVSNLYEIPGQKRLAERLASVTFADTTFFTNSGAEAVECAIKMARRYHHVNGAPERYRLITFEGAFHGRTLATIAAAKNPKHLDGFGPPMDGFDQVALGDLDAVRRAIGPATAAILIEPVQGEGGIRPAGNEFLRALSRLAADEGLLLVLDEVQTGMGRTGRLFAHEWAGIRPDIMAIAKALGGGFPIGACLATEAAAAGMTAGTHGSTFGGNPLAMAVANAALDVILEDGFLERARGTALVLRQKLARLVDEFPTVLEALRGEGLMLGLKCKVTNSDLIAAMLDQRLLAVGAGDNVVRFLPPLIVGEAEIDDALARTEAACRTLADRAEGGTGG
jgi:acetylornithine/N-succinyldiaminopimelate aminotransferase